MGSKTGKLRYCAAAMRAMVAENKKARSSTYRFRGRRKPWTE